MTKKIGLFGYGVVAHGFIRALEQNPQLDAVIGKICIKNPEKSRDLDLSRFTTDPNLLLEDPETHIIVELIDDAEAAYHLVKNALQAGKAVISGNKKMIAEHIAEVATWHQVFTAPFLYEAAVAGSIPILHNLEQFFKQQEIISIRGILNGSTNYVLTQMRDRGLAFEDALALAQEQGFAESDPTLDISGKDALYKLIILSYHAFGTTITDLSNVRLESITNMENQFYDLAAARGLKIKSVATAVRKNGTVRVKVQPELVGPEDELFGIENENNAIVIEAGLSGKQTYAGKGAGSLPTAAAVINDLDLLLNGFRYSKQMATRKTMQSHLLATTGRAD